MNSDSLVNKYKNPFLWGVFVALALALAWGQFFAAKVELDAEVPVATGDVMAVTGDLVPVGPLMARALPVGLRIPSIDLETTFVAPLGLEESGEIAVPDSYTEVGWYQFSPTPGQLGPSVVLGHVDSKSGPAVFFSLGQVKVGDAIYVDREDGTVAEFAVTLLERYDQAAFQTNKVYGNIDHAGLRLITCSGTFLRGKQRYTHNLVVYARLVEEVS